MSVDEQKVRLRRHPERGAYDEATIAAILDEGMIAHVGVVDDGLPVVIPTTYAREGSQIYLHGSTAARWTRILAGGAPFSLTVTLIDGLVLARSMFTHSINYRSVMMFSTATLVEDHSEKKRIMQCIVEHLVPGRTQDARPPTDEELAATAVFRAPWEHASAKTREGGPVDKPADLHLPVWAGVLPAHVVYGPPETAEGSVSEIPQYVRSYRRGRNTPPEARP
jgi:nitroimidazol reductase NimA-like FMN-containing flavoprotein (pyridoxamine 5'-phosphate oxidase superfamily)